MKILFLILIQIPISINLFSQKYFWNQEKIKSAKVQSVFYFPDYYNENHLKIDSSIIMYKALFDTTGKIIEEIWPSGSISRNDIETKKKYFYDDSNVVIKVEIYKNYSYEIYVTSYNYRWRNSFLIKYSTDLKSNHKSIVEVIEFDRDKKEKYNVDLTDIESRFITLTKIEYVENDSIVKKTELTESLLFDSEQNGVYLSDTIDIKEEINKIINSSCKRVFYNRITYLFNSNDQLIYSKTENPDFKFTDEYNYTFNDLGLPQICEKYRTRTKLGEKDFERMIFKYTFYK